MCILHQGTRSIRLAMRPSRRSHVLAGRVGDDMKTPMQSKRVWACSSVGVAQPIPKVRTAPRYVGRFDGTRGDFLALMIKPKSRVKLTVRERASAAA